MHSKFPLGTAIIISSACILVIAVHICVGDLIKLDEGTLVLLGIAVLPWLTLFFKKIKVGEVEGETLDAALEQGKKIGDAGQTIEKEVKSLLSDDLINQLAQASQVDAVRGIMKKQADKLEREILINESISVDLTAFGENFGVKRFPISALDTMNDLLNAVWAALTPAIKPYTYGNQWMLLMPNEAPIIGMRTLKQIPDGMPANDPRRLDSLNIKAGMTLKVKKL